MINFEKISLNTSYYLFNDMGDIDLNLLSINEKCTKNTDVITHEIKNIMTQNISHQNIDNEVPLCLSFSDVDAYIIEENESKYLIFALTENNRKMFEIYKKLWREVKQQIECNSITAIKFGKDPIKIRLDSYDDDLSLNKILCISVLDILCEYVFQIENNYYPQIQIHECECEY